MHCDWKKALEILKTEKAVFDLVFLDPPYAMTDLSLVFSDLVPVIHPEAIVVLEHESGKNITVSDMYRELKSRSWGFCAVSVYGM